MQIQIIKVVLISLSRLRVVSASRIRPYSALLRSFTTTKHTVLPFGDQVDLLKRQL